MVQNMAAKAVFIAILFPYLSYAGGPSNLAGTAVDETTIDVSWDPPVTACTAPTYDIECSLDNDVSHTAVTSPHTYADLMGGTRYQMTCRIDTTCTPAAAIQPYYDTIEVNTKPLTPTAEINMDEGTDINIVIEHDGSADSYIISDDTGAGPGSIDEPNAYIEGLTEGEIYTFTVQTVLGGVMSESVTVEHIVPEDFVLGLPKETFAWIMIAVIAVIFLIIIVVIIVLFVCCCTQFGKDFRNGRGRKKLDDETNTDEKEAWEYRDPYETADYRITNTQKKRAFAIAAQKAALSTQPSVY